MIENKETFRARIRPYFSPSDQHQIYWAYITAKFGHRAQVRKELVEGKPTRYFEHVRRVAINLMDEMKIMDRDMICAALLHDAVEDTEDITPELIEHAFGSDVAAMVTLLSKVPKEGYHERLHNCKNWKVLAIKACDRLDNLRSLMIPGTTREFQKKQVQETQEYYFPLFDQLLELCPPMYKEGIFKVRNEIIRLIVRYSTIIELQPEGTT
jgi:GTP diphosphokinase / guanosine-3',5'-bis(diphosphate) 3'-diphosphatase